MLITIDQFEEFTKFMDKDYSFKIRIHNNQIHVNSYIGKLGHINYSLNTSKHIPFKVYANKDIELNLLLDKFISLLSLHDWTFQEV